MKDADESEHKPNERAYRMATMFGLLLLAIERFFQTNPAGPKKKDATYQIAAFTEKVSITFAASCTTANGAP
jgi:hypothetical protein